VANRKKILVLECDKLLSAGLLSILASRSDFDVAQTTASSLAFLDQSENLSPDVVILDEEVMAANISAVIQLAERYPKLRLIVFRLNDNKVHVFDKHLAQLKRVSDLLELL